MLRAVASAPALCAAAFSLLAASVLTLGLSGAAGAKPLTLTLPDETAELRPGHGGPGLEAARNNCGACHSADYVQTQPPGKGKAFWEAEVTKMINVYKAPIEASDAKLIAEYLAETY